MQIDAKNVVSIHYRLTDSEGQLIEESFGSDPMVYLHGANNIIPGLENALNGKQVGDKLDVTAEPAEAYGVYQEALKQEVPLEAFQGVDDIAPGMRFMAETDAGPRPVVIAEVKDDTVVVDGNHPMAGQTLSFSVEVMEVRPATEEELAHGHVHAEGGCGHDHGDEADHECCGGAGHEDGSECCGSGNCAS